MSELEQELEELALQYAILDELHQKALLELDKRKESDLYGATFKFEDGNEMFIPVLASPLGLRANGQPPISYTINFDEKTMVGWLYQVDMALKKNIK